MPAGVPSAGANAHLAAGAVSVQIIVNEDRLDFRVAAADPIEHFLVTDVPEIAFFTGVAEPASIVAIGGGENQGWKVAVPGALVNFLHETACVYASELGVGQVSVAYDDAEF